MDPQRAALAGPPPLPRQETPGVAGAQQRTRHAGALPPATGDGRCAGSLGHPLRALARHPPRALRLSAAIVGSIRPRPAFGGSPAGPCSTGRCGQTTGMRRVPSAIPTERQLGCGITRPPRSLCHPSSSTSTIGSMSGWPPHAAWQALTSCATTVPTARATAWGISPRSWRNGWSISGTQSAKAFTLRTSAVARRT